jgi:type VI secretion system protein ImpL
VSEPDRRGSWRTTLRVIASVLLGAWAAGLVVAAVQLDTWNDELARTLLQIRADAVFRTRMVEAGEPIPREWYRSKALALLAASEKLQDDTTWALFVPGAWRRFDDLRPRVAARIEKAFSETAVETVRRELYFRASQLTGVPQDTRTAELVASRGCAPPAFSAAAEGSGQAAGSARQPRELAAIEDRLSAIEELDRAVQAMVALQSSGDPGNLRLVVRYTLGVELPGQLSRGAAFFRNVVEPEHATFAAIGVPRLQHAVRCSVAALMKALDKRLFERDDLLATETYLAQRAARLFAPGVRPGSYAQTVQTYREMVAALGEQEAMLASGDYGWLRQANSSLGPTHDRLLGRMAHIGLLGPEAVEQVRRQSASTLQRSRRQFGLVFGAAGDAALVWQPGRGRLVLSPQRLALRDALAALLREPYMAPAADHAFPVAAAAPLAWDTQRLEQALAIADAHRRFTTETLPMFPPVLRRGIAQFVEGHLAQLVQDATVEAMSPARPQGRPCSTPRATGCSASIYGRSSRCSPTWARAQGPTRCAPCCLAT